MEEYETLIYDSRQEADSERRQKVCQSQTTISQCVYSGLYKLSVIFVLDVLGSLLVLLQPLSVSVGSPGTRPLLRLHQLCVLLFVVPETNTTRVRLAQTLTARLSVIINNTTSMRWKSNFDNAHVKKLHPHVHQEKRMRRRVPVRPHLRWHDYG